MRTLFWTSLVGALCCAPRGAPPWLDGEAELVLLHVSDLHSHAFAEARLIGEADAILGLGEAGEWAEVGGLPRLRSLSESACAGTERCLIVDTGDAVNGTPLYSAFGGEAELAGLTALGVAAHVLGNHDLDAGVGALSRYANAARFPVLGANLVPDGSGRGLGTLVAPFALFHVGGLRVAVVGIANLASVAPATFGALHVLPRESTEAAQAAIDRVRGQSDVIVLATHLGIDADVELVVATTGADVVLGGHQHWVLEQPLLAQDCGPALAERRGCRPRDVPIVHSGAYGRYLGELRLELSSRAGGDPADRFEVTAHRYRALPARADVAEAPAVLAALEAFAPVSIPGRPATPLAYAPRPVERFGVTGGDSALGNLVADTLAAELGVELALFNASALRADLPAGPVTEDALYAALPFEDEPVLVWLSSGELALLLARAAERSRGRECTTSLELAGGRLRLDCDFGTATLVGRDGTCLAGDCGAASSALVAFATTRYFAEGGSGYVDPARVDATTSFAAAALRADRSTRGGRSLRAAVRARIAAGAPCSAGSEELPCLDAGVGAARDGRIELVGGG